MDKIGVPTKVVRDGTLYWTRDLEDVVWAALGANPIGVWCCVDATYGRGLTAEQRTAIPEVEAFIFRLLNRTATVSGHGLLRSYQSSTDCPGPEILAYLKETGRGEPHLSSFRCPGRKPVSVPRTRHIGSLCSCRALHAFEQ